MAVGDQHCVLVRYSTEMSEEKIEVIDNDGSKITIDCKDAAVM